MMRRTRTACRSLLPLALCTLLAGGSIRAAADERIVIRMGTLERL